MASMTFGGSIATACDRNYGNGALVHGAAAAPAMLWTSSCHFPRPSRRGQSAVCGSGVLPSTHTRHCDVDSQIVRDPQLDPEQHRRRREPACGVLPSRHLSPLYLVPSPQSIYPPQQLPPPVPSPQQRQQRYQMRDGRRVAGRQLVMRRHGRGCSGNTSTDLFSAPGIPEPGTVQDQSSCALVLLVRKPGKGATAQPPPRIRGGDDDGDDSDDVRMANTGGPAAAPTSAADGGQAGDGDGSLHCAVDAGCGSGSAGGDLKGVPSRRRSICVPPNNGDCIDGRLAAVAAAAIPTSAPPPAPTPVAARAAAAAAAPAAFVASTPCAAAAAATPIATTALGATVAIVTSERHCDPQQPQQQQRAVLVPLWERQGWVRHACKLTHGSEPASAVVSESSGKKQLRRHELPAPPPAASTTSMVERVYGAASGLSRGGEAGLQLQLQMGDVEDESRRHFRVAAAAADAPAAAATVGTAVAAEQEAEVLGAAAAPALTRTARPTATREPYSGKEPSAEKNRVAFPAQFPTAPPVPDGGSPLLPALLSSPTQTAVAAAVVAAAAATTQAAAPRNPGSGARPCGPAGPGRVRSGEGHGGDGGGGDLNEPPGADARRLMHAIVDCRHWRQLDAVLRKYGPKCNALHVTAALGKLTRMQLPPPPTPSSLPRPPAPPDQEKNLSPLAAVKLKQAAAAATPKINPRSADLGTAGEVTKVQALLSDLEAALRNHLEATSLAGPADGARADDRGSRNGNSSSVRTPSAHVHASAAMARAAAAAAGWCNTLGLSRLGPRQLATSLAAMARLHADGWRLAEDAALLKTAVAVSDRWGLESLPPQELTTFLYSFAKLGYHPGRAWLESACAAAADAATNRRMSPRQLSTTLWALATLRHHPGEAFMVAWIQGAVRAMAHFSAYDISQGLWALATLHRVLTPRPEATATAAAAEPPSHGLPIVFVRAALGRARAAMRPGGGGCAPQDVCNTLWAVSELQLSPPRSWVAAVAAGLLAAPDAALVRCRPADLAGLLWALAKLTPGAPPPRAAMLRVVGAAARLAGRCSEQDLANVLWALGVMRFRPPPPAMLAFGRRLLRLSVQRVAGPQLLSTALWCCVRLRLPPGPTLLRHLLAAAALRAPEFDPRSAPLLLYSLARLQHMGWLLPEGSQPRLQLPSPPAAAAPPLPLNLGPFLDVVLRGIAEAEVDVGGGRPRLALPVLLWSVVRLGHGPDEGWTRAFLAHSFEVLPLLGPTEACLVVSALIRLGHMPPPLWLDRMEHLTARRWAPAAELETAELRRQLAALNRRAAAAAAAASSPSQAGGPEDGFQSVRGLDAPATAPSGTGWERSQLRTRTRQRRRQVAARVLAEQLAEYRARLGLLRSSVVRLRRGLDCLRARVRQQQQEERLRPEPRHPLLPPPLQERQQQGHGCSGRDQNHLGLSSSRRCSERGDGSSISNSVNGRMKGCSSSDYSSNDTRGRNSDGDSIGHNADASRSSAEARC